MALLELLFLFSILVTTTLIFRSISAVKSQTLLPPSPLALPIIGHFHHLGPLIHRSFYNLSLRFGPIFSLRLGSVPCIIVTSPELTKEFLKTHELAFISHAQSTAIERLTYNSSLAFAPYGPYWRFIKKLSLAEFLSSRSVSFFASVRSQEYLRLLRLLAQKAMNGEPVNLTDELPKLSNNVIAKMMLGGSKGSSDEGRDEEARHVVREVTRIFGEFNLCDFVWFCKKFDFQGFGKRIEDTHRRFDALVEKVISEREESRKKKLEDGEGNPEEEEEEVKGFLDILLELLEKGSQESEEVKFTRVHIKALIMDFFTAGTDTTAISMEWALAELINHPNVLNKAREEIDRVVGKTRLAGESDGPNLPYIQVIIKETFRLHPPVSLLVRKSVRQCKVGEYVIPENTTLFVNIWAIGRDPKYWESPLEFRPERFVSPLEGGDPTSATLDVKGQHFQLLPFGSGRRMCPGLNLAMQMLPGLLAALIQCFDWKVMDGPDQKKVEGGDVVQMDERPGMTTPRAHDLVCVPVARLSPISILNP